MRFRSSFDGLGLAFLSFVMADISPCWSVADIGILGSIVMFCLLVYAVSWLHVVVPSPGLYEALEMGIHGRLTPIRLLRPSVR